MKKEYEEKLQIMRDFFINYDNISDEDFYPRRLEFESNLEELVTTKDQEVLECLLDFFDEDFDCEVDEVCEHIQCEIGSNFTLDQIIKAFYKKFDQFAENYQYKCALMSMVCVRNRQINDGHWDRFRQMFNTVKSKHSPIILEELKDMFEAGAEYGWEWSEEERKMVYALEEDMKSW
jgi:hypothetical protein